MPLDGVPHFDMLHPARRLWKARVGRRDSRAAAGCRRSSARCSTCTRVGDVPGFEIPGRFFQFLRSGDPRPLEPVLEHNRLDLVSLAAVTARAVAARRGRRRRLSRLAEALALGKDLRARRRLDRARGGLLSPRGRRRDDVEVRGEALYRLGLRLPPGSPVRGSGGRAGVTSLALTEPRHVRRIDARRRSGSSPPRRSRFITSTATRPDDARASWRCSRSRRPTADRRRGHAPPAGAAGPKARQKRDAQLFTS